VTAGAKLFNVLAFLDLFYDAVAGALRRTVTLVLSHKCRPSQKPQENLCHLPSPAADESYKFPVVPLGLFFPGPCVEPEMLRQKAQTF
jgi:hypothetical protein